jgi:hypothetical protein
MRHFLSLKREIAGKPGLSPLDPENRRFYIAPPFRQQAVGRNAETLSESQFLSVEPRDS